MEEQRYQLVRTMRCKNVNVPGVLGRLTTAIGDAGANIGAIRLVQMGHHYLVRDLDVYVSDEEHLDKVVQAISALKDVTLVEIRDEVLELHRGGKIKMVSTQPIDSLTVLRRGYTPGVADVCRRIQRDPSLKNLYTSIPASVAIVTNGTAILGLGNIGTVAGMPVMEGKAALLQQLVGISGIPILLDSTDADDFVNTVKRICNTFGGIHLEDVAAPFCFEVNERLSQDLDMPVMHDDQQGTATVVLAAVTNACHLLGRDIEKARIGQIGLGAAGLVIAEMLFKVTGNPVLGTARTQASLERHRSRGGIPSTLEEIMAKSDIVVATSGVKGLIKPEMVKQGQVILALSNPEAEIEPEAALAHGAALATDGKLVNNLLAYPGIWKGTLDCRARKINRRMLIAAAGAISAATPAGELMCNPLDRRVHRAVAQAVARAAMDTGVAGVALDDDYFERPARSGA